MKNQSKSKLKDLVKITKSIIPLGIVMILITACGNADSGDYATENSSGNESDYYEDMATEAISEEMESSLVSKSETSKKDADGNSSNMGTSDINPTNAYNAKIIRNADLKFKVDDVKKSSVKIANLVDMNGGYISNEDLSTNKYHYQTLETTEDSETIEYEVNTTNIIYIRVPSKNFQKLLTSMKGLALSEDHVKINAQDVTEEYYDLETRLKTKKEVEARYIQILKSNAKTLEEILLAEDKIRVVREEIEAVEGRLNFLKNKVNLSTIQLEIYQDPYYIKETSRFNKYEETGWKFGEKAGDAMGSGWNGILMFFIVVLYFWPLILIGAFVWWFIRRRIRKKRNQLKK